MSEEKILREDVAFLIPAYNEGSAIRKTIDGIPKRFPKIIVVDDGSRDNTKDQVSSTRAQLVSHTVNLGQGAALQTAIEYALLDPSIKYFVTYDADGQHRVEDVDTMLNYLQNNPVDIVLGSRFLGKVINMPMAKLVALKAAIQFSNITSGVRLTDTHNGLRVLNRKAAENMNIQMPDFSHASEVIERIHEKKLRYAEVPVTIEYTNYSRSKGQSILNAINISFDVIMNKVIR